MKTLVIDSATEACSVALFEGGELIAGELRMLGRGHAELLVPMIAALPDRGKAQAIRVALGPGSFTGVRIGLAAARALALAWGAEVLGYPTLALVAAMARARAGSQDLCVAMTGGHGEWFVAAFDAEGRETRALASLTPHAARSVPEALVAGTQADALVALRGHGDSITLWPDAREFMQLSPDTLRQPAPIYGRPPDARLPAGAGA